MAKPVVGDNWDVHQPKSGIFGLALWCSLAGFCLGFWVLDTVPVRAAAVCAALIGVILGHHLGRDQEPPQEGYR